MRVLLVGNGDLYKGRSAGQAVLRGLRAAMEERGYEVAVVSLMAMDQRSPELEACQIGDEQRDIHLFGQSRTHPSYRDDYRGRLSFCSDARGKFAGLVAQSDVLLTFEAEALELLGRRHRLPHLHIQGDPSFRRLNEISDVSKSVSHLAIKRTVKVLLMAAGETAFLWSWRRKFTLGVYGTEHSRFWSRILRRPVLDLRPYLEYPTNVAHRQRESVPVFAFGGSLGSSASRGGLASLKDVVLPSLHREFGPRGFVLRLLGVPTRPWIDLVAANEELVLMGEVDNFEEALGQADLFINPIQYSVGVRTRVCAALSVGMPVVSASEIKVNMPELELCPSVELVDTLENVGAACRGMLERDPHAMHEESREFFRDHYSIDSAIPLLTWLSAVAG